VRPAVEEDGYADQVIWGRDYPHDEGTYKYPESEDEESQTKHYLRWAFAGIPLETATKMLSDTAIHRLRLQPRGPRPADSQDRRPARATSMATSCTSKATLRNWMSLLSETVPADSAGPGTWCVIGLLAGVAS
jgi:hypothetical protein